MKHKNGTCWLDDKGNLIQAHGGMITQFNGKWYWFGENKDADNVRVGEKQLARVDVVGVSCYTSDDLHLWHYEGLALSADKNADPSSPLHPGRVMERPKVIYSEKTGKYVMWFHADSADYTFAHAGCAVADKPEGPYEFVGAFLPPERRDVQKSLIPMGRFGTAEEIAGLVAYIASPESSFTTGFVFDASGGRATY